MNRWGLALDETFFYVFAINSYSFETSSVAKTKWRSLVTSYFRRTQRKTIRKKHFPKLLDELFESSFTASTVSGGFRRAGVWPYNEHAMKEKVVRPRSSVTSSTNNR